MVTAAPARRAASALVALALAGSGALLGGAAAWADPTPAPGTSIDQPVPETFAPEAPAVQPSIGTWIIGGTELEATSVKPAGKPVARPAARPAAPVRTGTTSTPRSSSRGTVAPTAPDGATALPFTGGHVDALLPTGLALLVGGVALTLVSRPRACARC